MDGLHSTLRPFNGEPVIGHSYFLGTILDALYTTRASEAIEYRVFAYYFLYDSQDVHEEQMFSVMDDPEDEEFGLCYS